MTDLLSLLSRGYFPRELPAAFSTEKFATAVTSTAGVPASFHGNIKAKLAQHSLVKVGHDRRLLSIPNPVIQYNLSREIVSNWGEVERLTKRSLLSKSTPTPHPAPKRAVLPLLDHDDLPPIRLEIRSRAKFILQTDIAKCYSSIYTHSIPWAIHGKAFAKVHRGVTHWGNALDQWARRMQDGQTKGIPIGPDTSLIIAEIVLSAIDEELSVKLGKFRGFRYVDDFEFGFKTKSEAEAGLAIIHEVLKEYELETNSDKTEIIELPVPIEARWVPRLRYFPFRSSVKSQKTDLMSYFDLAFELAKTFPKDHVLKYAVARLRPPEKDKPGFKVNPSNWPLVQNFLFYCINVEPGSFLKALELLIEYHVLGYTVDLSLLEENLNSQIVNLASSDCGSEVAWAVWALVFFGVSVNGDAATALSKMRDPVVALLALDAQSRGLIRGHLDTTQWQSHMTEQDLYEPCWLLAYEANVKRWLPPSSGKDHVLSDSNFSFLKSAGVEFYDTSKTLVKVQAGTPVDEDIIAPLRSLADYFTVDDEQ